MKIKSHCRKALYFLVLMLANNTLQIVRAQENPDQVIIPPVVEQQLEDLTQANEDLETEDDSYLQELVRFIKDPLNLNAADESQLKDLKLLSPIQISNFLSYRRLLGNFIDIYELQAIPRWDVNLLRRIKPYVTVEAKTEVFSTFKSRLSHGNRSLLLRASQVLERSKGYPAGNPTGGSLYEGSPQKIFLRYKYSFKNLLQYGVSGEKDAGEQFFKGAQRAGFDFYSAHLFARNLGVIKALAVGDFTVSMGQGLTQWQSLAFKKSPDITNIKRQSDVLRPYNSAGEIIFNRGVGITLQRKNWETTGFVSYRKLDANLVVDTLFFDDYVTSLQTSGYHRTKGEIEDKNSQAQFTFGGNISYSNDRSHVGVNVVHYNFDHTINKSGLLYNKYAISGKAAGNYSIDYSYTFRNMHFFGEAAADENFDKAFINGLLISTDAHVSMSFVHRKISRGYQSLYTNAFTESTFPTNESGFFSGISIEPVSFLRIDAYADFYHFPWLRFRTDAPTSGSEYMVQFTYRPNKQVEMYVRYKTEKKAINVNPGLLTLNPVIALPKQLVRTQFSYKLNATLTLRSRIEVLQFDRKGYNAQNGFLLYTDVLFKPLLKPLSGNVRLQYFETDGYESRLYAYENDLLYSFSIPVFYEKGYRYYINVNYDLSRKISLWLKFAQTIYPGKSSIGSGLDVIKGGRKSELKLQAIYSF